MKSALPRQELDVNAEMVSIGNRMELVYRIVPTMIVTKMQYVVTQKKATTVTVVKDFTATENTALIERLQITRS